MSTALIYVVGPSGAGKDSLLEWLHAQLRPSAPVHRARRTIDRPVTADGEQHESVSGAEFQSLHSQGQFALHWSANGHRYGIRHMHMQPLSQHHWVIVNGSRAHLPQAASQYPRLTVLHITADSEVLRHRLWARGRETPQAIENRLQRLRSLAVPEGCNLLEVQNNNSLASAGAKLIALLQTLPGWPGA